MSQATLDRDPSRRVMRWRRYDRALAVAIAAAVLVFGIGIHAWLTGERVFAGPGATETAPVAVGTHSDRARPAAGWPTRSRYPHQPSLDRPAGEGELCRRHRQHRRMRCGQLGLEWVDRWRCRSG